MRCGAEDESRYSRSIREPAQSRGRAGARKGQGRGRGMLQPDVMLGVARSRRPRPRASHGAALCARRRPPDCGCCVVVAHMCESGRLAPPRYCAAGLSCCARSRAFARLRPSGSGPWRGRFIGRVCFSPPRSPNPLPLMPDTVEKPRQLALAHENSARLIVLVDPQKNMSAPDALANSPASRRSPESLFQQFRPEADVRRAIVFRPLGPP